MSEHPHQGQPVLQAGEPMQSAGAGMILLHGRGAGAEDILGLGMELLSPGWTYLAPQARGGTWYPYPFSAPEETNQPWLDSALAVVGELVAMLEATVPVERILLLGFSQGACLTLEYAARNARRYAGLAGLSGALIGPDPGPRAYPGSLDGTPVFLGCSDDDPYFRWPQVAHAAEVLGALGGEVTLKQYPGLGHTVNPDELAAIRAIMAGVEPS